MPHFRYTATDSTGKPIDGVIEAADQRAAQAALTARGAAVKLIVAVDSFTESERVTTPAATGSNGLRAADNVEVIGQMGSMMEAGLPLSVGLRTLAEELTRSSAQRSRTLLEMSNRIDAGESLDAVMADASASLPDWLVQMLHSGTESQTLTQSVHHYVQFTRLRNSLRGSAIAALAYPLILIAVSLIIFFGLFGWVVPQFAMILEDFAVELPGLTVLLVAIGRVCVALLDHLPYALAGLLSLSAVIAGVRLIVGPANARRLLYEVPLIGRVAKLTALCEFCHLLAMLVENRVPLPRALSLVSSAMSDPCLAQCAADAAQLVEQGESLSSVRTRVRNLPVELLRIPGFDHPDDSFPEALRTSSEIFAVQCNVSTRAMAGAATPVVIVVVGGITMITVIALFIPLIKLLNDLS
jgi:type II secretory pathway component PulF